MYPIGYGHYYSSSSSDWQPWTGGGFNRGINTPSIGSFNQINPFLNPFYPNNNNLINSGIFGLQTPPPTSPSNNNPFGNLLSALIGPPHHLPLLHYHLHFLHYQIYFKQILVKQQMEIIII
uniref:Uncharacterized protein n=1 Tax=Meloidogyne enterolobii TaxID=390850 RepID=A0A6V7WLW4_MELEN|nr:unnamed protein product [Meloidogyne enterolobii]